LSGKFHRGLRAAGERVNHGFWMVRMEN
jgi:hypothetical protein